MRDLRAALARVAPIQSTVLIIGESGSGKELVARELHRLGPGPKTPLVAVNCAALPEQLVESELFGHERGAFTGADRLRTGAFENAGSGTLFLDEIGELPLAAQAKLLRVLEDRQVMRVGGSRAVQVSARVVAATNRDLEREVEEGRFRRDLYYRLNVHVLRVPPLRDRLSDLPALVDSLLRTIASQLRVRPKRIAPDAVHLLAAYDWRKNNVRELRNCLERMMIASDAETIGPADVPPEIQGPGNEGGDDAVDPTAPPGTLKALKAQAERHIVLTALDKHDWHITQTAEALGLSDHSSLLKIMRRHKLTKGGSRDAS
jgi:DNA-binding NtrC family response regulator